MERTTGERKKKGTTEEKGQNYEITSSANSTKDFFQFETFVRAPKEGGSECVGKLPPPHLLALQISNASVALDQIPCGSPEDPPGARAYTRGILRGSAGDPQEIWSSVTPALYSTVLVPSVYYMCMALPFSPFPPR